MQNSSILSKKWKIGVFQKLTWCPGVQNLRIQSKKLSVQHFTNKMIKKICPSSLPWGGSCCVPESKVNYQKINESNSDKSSWIKNIMFTPWILLLKKKCPQLQKVIHFPEGYMPYFMFKTILLFFPTSKLIRRIEIQKCHLYLEFLLVSQSNILGISRPSRRRGRDSHVNRRSPPGICNHFPFDTTNKLFWNAKIVP